MEKVLLCSDCFNSHGIMLMAKKYGVIHNEACPKCGSLHSHKLDKGALHELALSYFVYGTFHYTEYGGSHLIQMNEYHYGKSDIDVPDSLYEDMKLIEYELKIGFFYYAPPVWKVGEFQVMDMLKSKSDRKIVFEFIYKNYPIIILNSNDYFYRVRVNPDKPNNINEYDSPPNNILTNGRLESDNNKILYGSQDLEICIAIPEIAPSCENFLNLGAYHFYEQSPTTDP